MNYESSSILNDSLLQDNNSEIELNEQKLAEIHKNIKDKS